jgi:hypothetical protein
VPVNRRDVVDDLDAADGAFQRLRIPQIAFRDIELPVNPRSRAGSDQHAYVVSTRREEPGEVAAREAGRAGD